MKLKAFSILLFLSSFLVFSQNSISGVIKDENGKPISNVEIYNKTNSTYFLSNEKGTFLITDLKEGENTIVFFGVGFKVFENVFNSANQNQNISIQLESLSNKLNEVTVIKEKEKVFAVTKLKDIEETAIYAGKKTEVVTLNNISANKATNNARQIFGQVVGLTINESNDGGLQLSIGGRGLNPNRTSNFNTRQNDYDISADVLGYPESYYATPTEALESIQIVRGAASLQYGTQFGGMVNFKMKAPSKKAIELVSRNTVASYNLFTNFTSLSGTNGKFSYYTFFNYKQGDGFRPNSRFSSRAFFTNLNYAFTEKTSLHFDYTLFDYLAKQPGGLTDVMFLKDPTQSNRNRNWFDVNWNLFAIRLKHHFDHDADFSLQFFGLNASRKALGFRSNRVSNLDFEGTERDLIIGDFVNWGTEARYLKKYNLFDQKNAFLIGAKYYQSNNAGFQGPGSSKSDANFNPATDEFPNYGSQSDYKYPNLNFSVFGETIFKVTNSFTLTPGFRYENIVTKAQGFYRRINTDLAGNVISDVKIEENIEKKRSFMLFGLGLSYKKNGVELYGNLSQNYRSVTFNDIRTASPSFEISPNITDEKGYTSDIGIRGFIGKVISFDTSIYALYYNDKIGETFILSPTQAIPIRYRDNIGTALTYGFETLLEWNVAKTIFKENENIIAKLFTNSAFTNSEYLKSDIVSVVGNKVEFVPNYNIKSGISFGYKNFLSSIQYTYVSSQFTNAENTKTDKTDNTFGIFGEIPSYSVVDFSASYKWKNLKLETGINNVLDNSYFTRRATGYPGPGIIPSEPRIFYTTLEFKF